MTKNTDKFITNAVEQSMAVKSRIKNDRSFIALIGKTAEAAIKVLKSGHKILLAGNGGSAADAQHIAGELINRFRFDRPALPAIALSTDTSVLTCIANDSCYDNIFARQIEGLGVKGDLFIGISTSGSSPNILKAFEACARKKVACVGLTGINSRKFERLCDYCLGVPSSDTPRVQESHIMIGHIICDIIERDLFGTRKM